MLILKKCFMEQRATQVINLRFIIMLCTEMVHG